MGPVLQLQTLQTARLGSVGFFFILAGTSCFADAGSVGTGSDPGSATSGDPVSEGEGYASDDAMDASTTSKSGTASPGAEDSTSDGPPSASSTSASSASTGGATSCLNTSECNDDEVCVSPHGPGGGEDTCEPAEGLAFALRIRSFNAPCDGVNTNFFYARVGSEVTETLFVECPQSWLDDWFVLEAGAPTFEVEFWEENQDNGDALITTWCWSSELGCGPVPSEVLHEGTFAVEWETFVAEFEFVPIE